MVYSSARAYAWDFCLLPRRAESDAPFQLLYLTETRQAPIRAVGRRQAQWQSLDLTSSVDLVSWSRRQSAVGMTSEHEWDRSGLWPGCVVERDGQFRLAYTGMRPNMWKTGIGLMTATDPTRWSRPAQPITHQLIGPGREPPECVQDPWIVQQAAEDAWYLFFVASDQPYGSPRWIGCARSRDLERWEPLGQVQADGLDGQIESIQVVPLAGRFYLLYTLATDVPSTSPRRRGRTLWTRREVRYIVSDRLTGPYRVIDEAPLLPDLYSAARIVDGPAGTPVILALRDRDDAGKALGVISDPAAVTVQADGRLSVDVARLWPAGWRLTNDLDRLPVAFVEQGLARGLLPLSRALQLVESARPHHDGYGGPIPRVDYLAAILRGLTLDTGYRFDLEWQALNLALSGDTGVGGRRIPHFESLIVLIPGLTQDRRQIALARARELARAVPHLLERRRRLLEPLEARERLRRAGPSPAESSGPVSDLTARAQRLAQALVDEMRRPGSVGDDSETGPSVPEPAPAGWQDDPAQYIEYQEFAATMALVPHADGPDRETLVNVALHEAGRVAHTGEFTVRDTSMRQGALEAIAVWLTTTAQRQLAAAIAHANGFPPPAALDWSPERLRREQARAPIRRFLGGRPDERWFEPDAWTVEQVLDNLPERKRTELIDDALDTLWHGLVGVYTPVFHSVGLRVVARRLSPQQIATQLLRFKEGPFEQLVSATSPEDIRAVIGWLSPERRRMFHLAVVPQAVRYAEQLQGKGAHANEEQECLEAVRGWLADPDDPQALERIERTRQAWLDLDYSMMSDYPPQGWDIVWQAMHAVREGVLDAVGRAGLLAATLGERRCALSRAEWSRAVWVARHDASTAAYRWQAVVIDRLLRDEPLPTEIPLPAPLTDPTGLFDRYREVMDIRGNRRNRNGDLMEFLLDDGQAEAVRRELVTACLTWIEPCLPSQEHDRGERAVLRQFEAALARGERPSVDVSQLDQHGIVRRLVEGYARSAFGLSRVAPWALMGWARAHLMQWLLETARTLAADQVTASALPPLPSLADTSVRGRVAGESLLDTLELLLVYAGADRQLAFRQAVISHMLVSVREGVQPPNPRADRYGVWIDAIDAIQAWTQQPTPASVQSAWAAIEAFREGAHTDLVFTPTRSAFQSAVRLDLNPDSPWLKSRDVAEQALEAVGWAAHHRAERWYLDLLVAVYEGTELPGLPNARLTV